MSQPATRVIDITPVTGPPEAIRRRCVMTGVAAAVAGVLASIGAAGPWLRVSFFASSASLDGTDDHLRGHVVILFGALCVAIGIGLLVLASASVVRTEDFRVAATVTLLVIGVLGVVLVVREYYHVRRNLAFLRAARGLTPLAHIFGFHVGLGWGIWLDVLSFAGLAIAAIVSLAVRPRY
jgi:hypothetical protein